ncbi:PQQ-binding-like beta-propeller repeat protein [bacterium]|nr:PQQ-binding-like beta-propeller repeat protein [bacterium]
MMKKELLIVILIFVIVVLGIRPLHAEVKTELDLTVPKLSAEETKDGPHLSGGVSPFWGTPCTKFTYIALYKDEKGRSPQYVRIWLNGEWHDMKKTRGENYKEGVLYTYEYIPTSGRELFYFFEASNGVGKIRSNFIDSPDQGPLLFDEKLDNNEIILLDKEGNKVWSFKTKNDWIEGVAISENDYIAAVSGYYIYLFSKDSNKPLWSFCEICDVPQVTMAPFNGVDISANGQYLAATLQTTLYFFEITSEKPLWQKSLEANAIGVAVSENGEYIAVGLGNTEGKGDKIILFDKKGNLLWEYKASHPEYDQTGNFYRPAITPDGKYIAVSSGCPDRRAYLFSKDGQIIFRSEMLTRDAPVHKSAISDDGSFITFVADNEQGKPNIFLFSKEGNLLWQHASPEDSTARAVSMSKDGKYIAAGTSSGNIYFFTRENSKPLWKFTATGKHKQVGDVKLSSDGNLLAAVSLNKKIYLFAKENNQPLWVYQAPTYVTFVDFNGRYLVAGTGAREYLFEGNTASKKEIECKEVFSPTPPWAAEEEERREPAICGDGICEEGKGESYENCPEDCIPEKDSENTSEVLKKQRDLWSVLVLVIAIILIIAVTTIIILKYRKLRKKKGE